MSTEQNQDFQEVILRDLQEICGADRVFNRSYAPKTSRDVQAISLPERMAAGSSEPGKPPLERPATISLPRYFCDGCDQPIEDIRMNCQDCPNFDHCPACYVGASKIHPGHKFKALHGNGDLEPGKYNFAMNGKVDMFKQDYPLLLKDVDTNASTYSCQSCRKVASHLSVWHIAMLEKLPEVPHSIKLETTKMEWTIRISQLAEATALGCAFCAFVFERLFGPGNAIGLSYHPQRPWYLKSDNESGRRKEVLDHAMKLCSRFNNDRFILTVTPAGSCSKPGRPWLEKLQFAVTRAFQDANGLQGVFANAGKQDFELFVFAAAGNPASVDAVSRVPNASPGSAQGFAQINEWVGQCQEKHGRSCSGAGSESGLSALPSRVIDVSEGSTLSLKEPQMVDKDRYCALSYTWGGPQEFCLSSDTLPALTQGFSIDQLPATIVDAVKVTQSLGIRYLWVDALCILQDNIEDRSHEVSRMEDVFRNSYLTIIAANSSDVKQGFLGSHADEGTGLWKSLIPFKYPIITMKGKNMDEVLALKRDNMLDTNHLEYGTLWLMDDFQHMNLYTTKDPVANRGWCLQERLLSARVLNYGRWPSWRCFHTQATDGGLYLNEDLKLRKGDEFSRLLLELARKAPSSELEHFLLNKVLHSWYGIVQDFSRRKLSLSGDRLPAIGGVASLMSRITGHKYLAGLWQNNILHDLMWYADTREWLDRPSSWRAPTWSWASVKSAVKFGHIDADATPLARVSECMVTYGSAGPFGEVKSGEVSLLGKMRLVPRHDVVKLLVSQYRSPRPPKSDRIVDWYRQMLESMEHNEDSKPISNEDAAKELPDKIFAIVTFKHNERTVDEEQEFGDFYSGLLLEAIGDHFERIGSFKHEALPWLDLQDEEWQEKRVCVR